MGAGRLPKAIRERIEAKALQIYDLENPDHYTRIKVSKAECIRRATAIIAPKTRKPNKPKKL